MSGLGESDWTVKDWERYEASLKDQGLMVLHCAHCDRSNRHPSCQIVPLDMREAADAD